MSKRCLLFERFLISVAPAYDWFPFVDATCPYYSITATTEGRYLTQYSLDMHSAKVWAGEVKPIEAAVMLKINDAILTAAKGGKLTLEHIPQVLPYQIAGRVEHNANTLGYSFLKWRMTNGI